MLNIKKQVIEAHHLFVTKNCDGYYIANSTFDILYRFICIVTCTYLSRVIFTLE